jgi:hypothetical protein
MTYRGTVQKGVVVLDEPARLPDGAKVEVSLIDADTSFSPGSNGTPSVFDQLKDLAGTVEGLPADIAENHDHYLYGTRKR